MASECERITQENQVHSPLLRLPAELRNRIYELAFPTTAIKVHPAWDDPKVYPGYDGPRGIMALLQTCRQINAEATEFFLSTLTFDTESCSLHGFVKAFGGDKAALVTSIIFKLWDIVTRNEKHLSNQVTSAIHSLKAVRHSQLLVCYTEWSACDQRWTNMMRELFGKRELEVVVVEIMDNCDW